MCRLANDPDSNNDNTNEHFNIGGDDLDNNGDNNDKSQ